MLDELLQIEVAKAVEKAFPGAAAVVELSVPSNPDFGDFATNVAMTLSRSLKKKPREIAESVVQELSKLDSLESVSIAGPGFINLKVRSRKWVELLALIADQKGSFGQTAAYKGRRAMVEFVSANPTGPLHIGHGRNAVVGDVLAKLFAAAGYDVTKEYYINDGGIQIATLGRSVYLRIKELQGEKIEFPENLYQGAYITDMARHILDRKSGEQLLPEKEAIEKLGQWAGDTILEEIKADLARLGVVFDKYFFESVLYREGKVEAVLKELKEKSLSYEKDGALWLHSMKFGDDKDRVLIKSDHSYTYLTPDIAYHRHKYKQGYDLMVNVWGADHGGYVGRLKGALTGLGYPSEKLHVVLIQMVNLIRGGEMVSMSTRRATYETLEAVVKEVGPDVARYFFMMRSYQSQLDFDLELAKAETSDNPAYYIQYAHARICSVFAKAREEGKLSSEEIPYDPQFAELLSLPEEIGLTKFLLSYPKVLKQAADELAPHRVTFYVLELARAFQSYYDRARADPAYRILTQDEAGVRSKMFLLGCVRQVLRNALQVLGVSAPEKM